MFERYTEKARRAIFFARYEASQFGSSYIETEHLLLGLLRENKALARFGGASLLVDPIREEIQKRVPAGKKLPTSVDMPLSVESKRVLTYAQEEAERLSQKHIGTEHLLAALLREEGFLAAEILHERGLTLEKVRGELARVQQEPGVVRGLKPAPLAQEFTRDLTQEAIEGRNDPVVGRENEMERLIETLCRRSKNNPVLVGEAGVGKAAMVKGLAQRIVESTVPPELAGKRIISLFLSSLMSSTRRSEERAAEAIRELVESHDVIVFIEELFVPAGREGRLDAVNIMRAPLARSEFRCIASATPSEYQASLEKEPWLDRHFHAILIPAPDEADAIKILFGIRSRYEKFHGVTYTDEALEFAVRHSVRYLPVRALPDKAIDLIDEAGALVKVRPQSLPDEVVECERRIRFATHQMENAISNHEFEKARFYDDELVKERENLKLLKQRHQLDETAGRTVTRKDIEQVIARWIGIPISSIGQVE
jgi:ATP-dependent Clp protease ATP-binding subunit ClpC